MLNLKIKKKKFPIGLILVVVISLVFIFAIGFRMFMRAKYSNMKFPMPEPEISVFTAKEESVQLFEELPARVASYEYSEIRPQVSGIVTQVLFKEGGFVKKGQQLYQIATELYKANYEKARSTLKTATETENRYQSLLKENAVSKAEYENVLNIYNTAKADFQTAKTNLEYTKVNSPISGFIGASSVTKGALVSANQEKILATITELNPTYIEVIESRKEVAKLGNISGMPVTIILENDDYPILGNLQFSQVMVDATTDSVKLRAIISNPENTLLPGMFVKAKLHLEPIKAILIPQKSAFIKPDGSLNVWVLNEKDGLSVSVKVKAEKIKNNNWVVTEGLKDGDLIINEIMKLREGSKVKLAQTKNQN